MRVIAPGIEIDLPTGWEAVVDDGAGAVPEAPPVRTPRVHIANFALPEARGDYGSGAVDLMRGGDVLICLLEELGDAAGSTLHGHEGIPSFRIADFSPDAMQRARPGQSGAQGFFHVGGRAFVLYVVLADRLDRRAQVAELNRVLAGVRILT